MADDNTLYYGDNLDILRRYVPDESVDLIYLDPPFNSAQDYNVLFREQDGTRSASQIKAFGDTWRWDEAAALAFQETVELGGRVSLAMQGFRSFLGDTDMLAYLSMMAPRLVELRRVLKSTGSIYLHCDPTASHYLKMLLDSIFGAVHFQNEIVWQRTHAHGSSKRYGPVHDIILMYSKSDDYQWTDFKIPHDPDYIERHFKQIDAKSGRRFQAITLTGSGVRHGESGKPWRDVNPTKVGRHWALPGDIITKLGITGVTVQDKLDALDDAGMVYWPDKADGTPRLKWYVDALEGTAIPDVWVDIAPISAQAKERLGYPTQKPEALLERILSASSNESDTVLDPFCGCGTTIAASQRLKRNWIGIDITHLAITLIRHRLWDAFGEAAKYKVIGEPAALSDAQKLALDDRFQFQWWSLGLVGARPVEQKKGADQGIDGRLFFHDEGAKGTTKQVMLSVKSGGVGVKDVRDLRGVIEREKAAIGVLITLEESTKPMRTEAAGAGFYNSPWGTKHPILQILTIEELLNGKGIDYPHHTNQTFKRAPRKKTGDKSEQGEML